MLLIKLLTYQETIKLYTKLCPETVGHKTPMP